MLFSTHDGSLINLRYIGAVYMRKSNHPFADGTESFDVIALPYDKIHRLAVLQPHETNPKYEPIESFEIVIRQGLEHHDAVSAMISMSEIMNKSLA